MDFSDDLYQMIYGKDVDIKKLKEIKSTSEIWNDIHINLANGDITKIEAIKQMPALEVLTILESKLKPIPKLTPPNNPIGYK